MGEYKVRRRKTQMIEQIVVMVVHCCLPTSSMKTGSGSTLGSIQGSSGVSVFSTYATEE